MAEKKWRALDHCDDHCRNNDADVEQDAVQKQVTKQISDEWIIVRDSECVEVTTTDTQIALSLQLAIQAAIVAVISITIGDNEQGKNVAQDLKQFMKTKQSNRQKTIIEGSKNVKVKTTDTDISVNIQALLQILVTVVAKLDVL
ncbi:spore coat protein [Ureibacillus aquaedulcis]|uniref:Spore coat protein n=1 Tax=Ureibacillus aquaedulcis TaxID=3058421 RepID=A0ABT8GRG6_9BACL|nr:spore coat protein [Ureibacillus sp. BA0131]MDN4493541.1 spore coat protein [Ureibacillus sp. BA0131]